MLIQKRGQLGFTENNNMYLPLLCLRDFCFVLSRLTDFLVRCWLSSQSHQEERKKEKKVDSVFQGSHTVLSAAGVRFLEGKTSIVLTGK